MSIRTIIGWLFVLLMFAAVLPRESRAADWTVSPYRAQVAQAPTDEDGAADSIGLTGPVKKNIGKGVLFSLIIPGTGQLYSGSWLRSLPWFAIEIAGWAMFANYHAQGVDKTDEFEAFAGPRETPNNFDTQAYLYYEYTVAHGDRGSTGRPPFTGGYGEWRDMEWDAASGNNGRTDFLPSTTFTHDVMTGDIQQYYEMIGKYFYQFGFGWIDTWTGDVSNPDWTTPDPGVTPDNAATLMFDGDSPLFFQYRDMRADANDMLEKGNVAMEVVLVNHILSALDAAFAVRSYNKRLAAENAQPLGGLKLSYDAFAQGGYDQRAAKRSVARMLKLSIPLN